MTYPDPPACHRCGVPGHVEWVSAQTLGDREPVWRHGNEWCVTPGCVDETGSRTLFAPTPGQMRNRADAAWMARQQALMDDR